MRFEWDEEKFQRNISKHGIDFHRANSLFFVDHVTFELESEPEKRWAIIGRIDDKFYTGIYTKRGSKIRWISVRRSRVNEEKYFENYFY